MLHSVLLVIDMVCCGLIALLVLIQRGKGADAGAGFGAGASGTVFGARGAGTALSRATAILAAVFMITSLSLAYTGKPSAQGQPSLLDQLSSQQLGGAASPADTAPVAPTAPTAPPAK